MSLAPVAGQLGLEQRRGPSGFAELTGGPSRARVPGRARDEAAAARLWEVSEQLTGVSFLTVRA